MYQEHTQVREPKGSHADAFNKMVSQYDEKPHRVKVRERVAKLHENLSFPPLPKMSGEPLRSRTASFHAINPNREWFCKDKGIVLGGHATWREELVVNQFELTGETWKFAEAGADSYVSYGHGLYRPVGSDLQTASVRSSYILTERAWTSIVQKVYPSTMPSQDAALAAALADANSATYDALTDLAEAPETLYMLAGFVSKTRRALLHLGKLSRKTTPKQLSDLARYLKKHGSVKRVPKHLDNALGYWLYYRYGVMPLYLSIQDIVKAATREHITFETSRGNDSYSQEDQMYHGPFLVDYTVVAKARGYVKTGYGNKGKGRVGGSLPTTLWEVVPFSFVVDWFVGVGDFISSYTPANYKERKATVSTQLEITITVTLDGEKLVTPTTPPTPHTRYSWDPVKGYGSIKSSGKVTYVLKRYSRGLSDMKPKLQPKATALSWQRRLDALALSWKLLASLKKGK